jgi:hypothetical protein
MTRVLLFFFYALNFMFTELCRFQQTNPSFNAFLNLAKCEQKLEYKISDGKGKLTQHFKKWTINLENS